MLYAFSSYHKEFDYDKLCENIKELGLSPSAEYANKFDIAIIRKFCNCYKKMSTSEKHCILQDAAMSLIKEDISTFFNILCTGENDCYTYEQIMVILNCDKWSMTQKEIILKNCKKEEVFSKMF